MNPNKNDIFFGVYIRDKSEQLKGGLAVHIPTEASITPGDRIKSLTASVRAVPLPPEQRTRTEILVAPPTQLVTKPLTDYLWADGSLNDQRLQRHLISYAQGVTPHRFIPRCGVPALGPELIGREGVYQKLNEAISSGRSCHLRAPRRYGKTSLLMRAATQLPNAVLMQLEDVGSLPGFFKALLRACLRHEAARNCLAKLSAFGDWLHDTHLPDPAAFNQAFEAFLKLKSGILTSLLRETFAALAEGGIVLLIDEFSVFLRDMHDKPDPQLKSFLEIFKDARTRAAAPQTVVLAGSSGLSTYIAFYDMRAAFEDITPLDVQPISMNEGRLLAEELFYGMEKRPLPAAVDRVVHFTGGNDTIPYFVHALAHVATEEAGLRASIEPKDVERAYQDRLLGPPGNHFFRDFLLRERAYPPSYRASASAILKELSRRYPEGVTENRLKALCSAECDLIRLLTCLEEDYDLVKTADAWRMRSKVLADRWRIGEPWLTRGGAA